MLQFKILNGRQAGTEIVARRFPFIVGRDAASDLRLEEAGVWEQHWKIELTAADGFQVVVRPDALVAINGQAVRETALKNGDVVEFGPLRVRVSLSPTRPRNLAFRELSLWLLIAGVALSQIILIYRLLN